MESLGMTDEPMDEADVDAFNRMQLGIGTKAGSTVPTSCLAGSDRNSPTSSGRTFSGYQRRSSSPPSNSSATITWTSPKQQPLLRRKLEAKGASASTMQICRQIGSGQTIPSLNPNPPALIPIRKNPVPREVPERLKSHPLMLLKPISAQIQTDEGMICPVCPMGEPNQVSTCPTLPDELSLRHHIKVDHEAAMFFECQVPGCEKLVLGIQLFDEHLKTEHPEHETPSAISRTIRVNWDGFICVQCNEFLPNEPYIVRQLVSRNKRVFRAKFCTMPGGLSEWALRLKRRRCTQLDLNVVFLPPTSSIPGFCPVCSVELRNVDIMNEHLRQQHPGRHESKIWTCNRCSQKYFRSFDSFVHHHWMHRLSDTGHESSKHVAIFFKALKSHAARDWKPKIVNSPSEVKSVAQISKSFLPIFAEESPVIALPRIPSHVLASFCVFSRKIKIRAGLCSCLLIGPARINNNIEAFNLLKQNVTKIASEWQPQVRNDGWNWVWSAGKSKGTRPPAVDRMIKIVPPFVHTEANAESTTRKRKAETPEKDAETDADVQIVRVDVEQQNPDAGGIPAEQLLSDSTTKSVQGMRKLPVGLGIERLIKVIPTSSLSRNNETLSFAPWRSHKHPGPGTSAQNGAKQDSNVAGGIPADQMISANRPLGIEKMIRVMPYGTVARSSAAMNSYVGGSSSTSLDWNAHFGLGGVPEIVGRYSRGDKTEEESSSKKSSTSTATTDVEKSQVSGSDADLGCHIVESTTPPAKESENGGKSSAEGPLRRSQRSAVIIKMIEKEKAKPNLVPVRRSERPKKPAVVYIDDADEDEGEDNVEGSAPSTSKAPVLAVSGKQKTVTALENRKSLPPTDLKEYLDFVKQGLMAGSESAQDPSATETGTVIETAYENYSKRYPDRNRQEQYHKRLIDLGVIQAKELTGPRSKQRKQLPSQRGRIQVTGIDASQPWIREIGPYRPHLKVRSKKKQGDPKKCYLKSGSDRIVSEDDLLVTSNSTRVAATSGELATIAEPSSHFSPKNQMQPKADGEDQESFIEVQVDADGSDMDATSASDSNLAEAEPTPTLQPLSDGAGSSGDPHSNPAAPDAGLTRYLDSVNRANINQLEHDDRYECTVCTETFAYATDQRYHHMFNHVLPFCPGVMGGSSGGRNEPRHFCCIFCGGVTAEDSYLIDKHVLETHVTEFAALSKLGRFKWYFCLICGLVFCDLQAVELHILYHREANQESEIRFVELSSYAVFQPLPPQLSRSKMVELACGHCTARTSVHNFIEHVFCDHLPDVENSAPDNVLRVTELHSINSSFHREGRCRICQSLAGVK